MITVDLVTGFLGAGKTTFIKKYANYFMEQGQKVGILENDYGAVNVDMLLLNELRGENCELEMVAGGCDADCHKRRFKTKLISMGMSGYNRVIIEPSGIFDVDEFFDSLREEPLDRWYQIGNVITIVDGKLEENLSERSDYYLATEVANAGTIILSRTQLATDEEIESTICHIHESVQKIKCRSEKKLNVIQKNWDELNEDDFKKIASSGYHMSDFVKKYVEQDEEYSTLYFLEHGLNKRDMEEKIPELFQNNIYGEIHRIKGFFKDEEGKWYQLNSTKKDNLIDTMPVGQEVIIIIGSNLNKVEIDSCLGYKGES